MNQTYVDTVRLLLAIAPRTFRSPCFAKKGGTALNLFVQHMPRLSVNIDVVLTDHSLDRAGALNTIFQTLARAQGAIEAKGCHVGPLKIRQGDEV